MSELSDGLSRREFLRVSALSGGGLLAACWFGSEPASAAIDVPVIWQPNAYVRLTSDNVITVIVGSSEIGQGVATAVPMMVAEELDADWLQVRWEQSGVALPYFNPRYVLQITAASSTVSTQYLPQRRAGAAIRQMLLRAAATRWGVPRSTLRTRDSVVIHDGTGRRATYGELAEAAAQLSPPLDPPLKDPSNFRIIGRAKRRLDSADKVDGSCVYGMDFKLPGMLTALLARAPALTQRIPGVIPDRPASFDAAAALAVPGVVSVFEVPLIGAVCVAARDFWSAKKGREALNAQWTAAPVPHVSTDEQLERYRAMLDLPGVPMRLDGTGDLLQAGGAGVISADYEFPYLAHATMETLNVTIDYAPGRCSIWTGTQWPDLDRAAAAALLGLLPDQVEFHVMPSGGGFGRRGSLLHDFVIEAALVARELQRPVKVMWTREDDIGGGYYRPSAVNRVSATLGGNGLPTSWRHRVVTQPLLGDGSAEEALFLIQREFNSAGGASDQPYAIPNVLVDLHSSQDFVPVLWWRSVANSFNVFAREAFVDELAHAAGRDPYDYRHQLLRGLPRLRGVLEAAAQAAGWGTPAPRNVHRGIAAFSAWGSFIAQVVEASVGPQRQLVVHRVVSAADCGVVINPDGLRAQIESSVIFALSAALFGEVTLQDGVPQQGNFHDYPVLRMYQAPQIETVLVDNGQAPGGAGELGVPAVAPALANAIFGATGERIRTLPLKRHFRIP